MVVGSGMIATRFAEYTADERYVIFASGVSNSRETDAAQFARETHLLEKTIREHPDKTLVYFSTCSIEDPDAADSNYVQHKKKMEAMIRKQVRSFYIFRVSNVAGTSNNPYTLLNFFVFNILRDIPVTIWKNACRNIIGIDDVYSLIHHILSHRLWPNSVVNIANTENYSVPEIVETIEHHLSKQAIKNLVDKGEAYRIDVSLIKPLIETLGIRFDDSYLSSLLKKYYHSR